MGLLEVAPPPKPVAQRLGRVSALALTGGRGFEQRRPTEPNPAPAVSGGRGPKQTTRNDGENSPTLT
eukprot:2087795-Alexandrium_andersonii.AAC.1